METKNNWRPQRKIKARQLFGVHLYFNCKTLFYRYNCTKTKGQKSTDQRIPLHIRRARKAWWPGPFIKSFLPPSFPLRKLPDAVVLVLQNLLSEYNSVHNFILRVHNFILRVHNFILRVHNFILDEHQIPQSEASYSTVTDFARFLG